MRRRSTIFSLLVLTVSVAACGSSVQAVTGGGGQSGTGAGGQTGTGTTTQTGTPCVASTCAADEVCIDQSGACDPAATDDVGDSNGACVKKPTVCSDGTPACGCDGKVYDSACAAQMAGQDVGDTKKCQAPEGYFACSTNYCPSGSVCYFYQVLDTPDPLPTECVPPPAACQGNVTCGCLLANAMKDPFQCGDATGVDPQCDGTGSELTMYCEIGF